MSENKEVQDFITEIMLTDPAKYPILEAVRNIVFEHYPKIKERMMYGGIMFILKDDFGGVFVYKNHVSFEFSLGFKLKDPDNLLEGGGKHRRHLKIKSNDSIQMKNLVSYVKQIESLLV